MKWNNVIVKLWNRNSKRKCLKLWMEARFSLSLSSLSLSISFYFFNSILNDDEKALVSFCWDYGVASFACHVVDARFVSSIVIFLCANAVPNNESATLLVPSIYSDESSYFKQNNKDISFAHGTMELNCVAIAVAFETQVIFYIVLIKEMAVVGSW